MRRRVASVALVAVLLTACSGGGSSDSSTSTAPGRPSTTTGASSTTATTVKSGGGDAAFQPRGCTAPSADEIGTALGTPVTKTLDTADNGCLWQAGPASQGVQVSYHTPADFNALRLSALKTGATAVNVPGANDAFLRHITLPNGVVNDVEYVVFDQGTVQIAFTGPTGFLTAQKESAVTQAIVG